MSLNLDSTSYVAHGKWIQFSFTCIWNATTSESLLPNKEAPSGDLSIGDECVAKNGCDLISFESVFLATHDMKDGKCVSSLCKSHFTVAFSAGLLSNHFANDVGTFGIDESVRGIN